MSFSGVDSGAARFVLIVVGSGVISSLTDWFFAGDWLHRRYTYPEVWRQGYEGRAIALTSPLPFVTCTVFVAVIASLDLHSVAKAVGLAAAIWLIGRFRRLSVEHPIFWGGSNNVTGAGVWPSIEKAEQIAEETAGRLLHGATVDWQG